MTVALRIWLSIPNYYVKWASNLEYYLGGAIILLSIATNAITTTMIAYKLWYVAVSRIHNI